MIPARQLLPVMRGQDRKTWQKGGDSRDEISGSVDSLSGNRHFIRYRAILGTSRKPRKARKSSARADQ